MDVRSRKEEIDEDYADFTITINNNIVIQTLVVDGDDEYTVNQWIRDVQRIYGRNKNLVVNIFCETATYHEGYGKLTQPPKKRIDKLLLFVGSHCLLIDPDEYEYGPTRALTTLKSFLLNPRVIFVGLGIDNFLKVLEADKNLHVAKSVNLYTLVEHVSRRDDLGQYDVERLAKLVLGDMYGTERPQRKIKWYTGHYNHGGPINEDKVKFATFDAFLSYQTAVKCIEMIRTYSYIENKNASSSSSSS